MEIIYSQASHSELKFLVATINGKLAGCTVPSKQKPDVDRFLGNLHKIYQSSETRMGKIPNKFVEAILNVFNGAHHQLKQDEIAFEQMRDTYLTVLKTLFTVKKGDTVSYSELALKSGLTKGHSRFVGLIMARNPIPLIIPCHRVLPLSGKIGNYSGSGGIETKKRLLEIEAR